VNVVGLIWLLGGLFGMGYGLVDVLAPRVAIRWQVRSTAKHRSDFRGVVGTTFQRWTGTDPDGDPWNEPRVRRNVRLIGLALILCSAGFSYVGLTIIRAS
jgi:hypothetical protein